MKPSYSKRIAWLGMALLLTLIALSAVIQPTRATQSYQVPGQNPNGKPSPPSPIHYGQVQFNPQGSDEYMVWSEGSLAVHPTEDVNSTMNATFDIMGEDLQTGKNFVVSDAPNNQLGQRISGSLVVWEDNSHSCAGCEYDVLGKDLATGATYQIATGPTDQSQPAIAGTTVVWVESASDGKSNTLFSKDLGTGKITTITAVPRSGYNGEIVNPLLSDEYIVWAELGEQGEVSLPVHMQAYDRRSGVIATVVSYTVDANGFPRFDFDGHRLVWDDPNPMNGGLKLLDLHTGQSTTLYKGGANRPEPVIKGDVVLWSVSPISSPGAGSLDIYGINLADSNPTPVALITGGTTTGEAAIAGGWLVWLTKGGTEDGQINFSQLHDILP